MLTHCLDIDGASIEWASSNILHIENTCNEFSATKYAEIIDQQEHRLTLRIRSLASDSTKP